MQDEKLVRTYTNLDEALDNIKFNNRSLRELLLETDLDFDSIS